MQPDQALFLLHSTLPTLKREHDITKRMINAIPADECGYQPNEVCKSALDLAWHIVGAELMFLNGIVNGEFVYGSPRPEGVKTPAEILAWYEENFQAALPKLEALSADALVKPIDFRGVFKHPAVAYLGFLMHHSIHHRGQLSMYLRPMGAKVPSIYGESYDDAQARKAAQSA